MTIVENIKSRSSKALESTKIWLESNRDDVRTFAISAAVVAASVCYGFRIADREYRRGFNAGMRSTLDMFHHFDARLDSSEHYE